MAAPHTNRTHTPLGEKPAAGAVRNDASPKVPETTLAGWARSGTDMYLQRVCGCAEGGRRGRE
eukprot:31152-Chlamydomonas_euryale.AAC.3